MNTSEFNKVLYKGNINIDFYLYCLKKNHKIFFYIFINLFLYLLTFISIRFNNLYESNKYKYLKHIKDLNKLIKEFYKNNKKINKIKNIDTIIDTIPSILIPDNLSKKIISYELTKDYKIDKTKYNKELSKINKTDILYVRHINNLDNIKTNKIIRVKNGKQKTYTKRYPILNNIKTVLSIFIISLILTCISFLFTCVYIDPNLINKYFEFKLFILNFLPTFLFISLLTIITKRVHIAYVIDTFLLLLLGISNQTKLLYRDDVAKVSDLFLLKEASIMSTRYEIYIRDTTIVSIITIVIMFFIIKKYIPKLQLKLKKHIISIILTLLVCISVNTFVLHNKDIYNAVGNTDGINIWIDTRQSQIRGLVYPFTYSYTEMINIKPDGYNKKEVEEILNKYEYSNMKEKQKVNIIAIMLEAYQDVSKWEQIGIDESVYKEFHKIQKDSISGELVTNIFGGGTIDTERKFLTGYFYLTDFRSPNNSYAWYFKEQGYRVDAMHPIYGAFYNRNTVNENLGFDEYYDYENRFSKLAGGWYANDKIVFDEIIKEYEKYRDKEIPYFNFTVTYQNHGPYDDSDGAERDYFFEENNYNNSVYNITNSYLTGIKSTNEQLAYLVDYFDNEEEPTIIILFGDHNPYLGEGGFEELGINMDLGTDKGFDNYYKTPYIIHANDSAKEVFDKDFIGKGEDMSPNFLMSYVLDYCGIKGSDYNQYVTEYFKTTKVINSYLYKNNNVYIRITNETPTFINEYQKVNYYYANNFKYK
ncbi:MAG: LTA synthase family protein [Candidatus Coprovivens sp.]